MCLTKIPTHDILKQLSVIYFQNLCIVTFDLSKKRCIALLFMDGFGILFLIFSYWKHPTQSSIV